MIDTNFILFAAVLAGVACFHRHALGVAVAGALLITAYNLFGPGGFHGTAGWAGLQHHAAAEWVTLANLLGLLLGFALLSDHFAQSRIPALLPSVLPDDWKGGLVMLVLVFVLSAFLDNIAAAMIGGTVAMVVYQRRVHTGFLVGIVAAANAGGSGSVVGDTTTTMMWIAGVGPLEVVEAYAAAVPALLFFGVVAARQQHAHQPIIRQAPAGVRVDWARAGIVALMLSSAIGANVYFNLRQPEVLAKLPVMALAVWAAILVTSALRRPNWSHLRPAATGAAFLLSLVWCASMMPVEQLPEPSWPSVLGMGAVSAVFDNIPLTALALHQGGYDWGFVAYAVGFGGSMMWFGSSAGVALASDFPQARSVLAWLRHGWHVGVAYLLGFAVLVAVVGWHPSGQAGAATESRRAAASAR
jgi:Na+/H+ antiporter NhaD/arsenite permease-like protein